MSGYHHALEPARSPKVHQITKRARAPACRPVRSRAAAVWRPSFANERLSRVRPPHSAPTPDKRSFISSDISDMGVLYDVLFKPIGRSDLSTATTIVADGPTDAQLPPEWVLDRRDSGSLVWRRYDLPPSCRRRVRFLDAVQVRVFERDDCADVHEDCSAADADDEDGQLCWADDWCWDKDDDSGSKTAFCGQADRDDYPVLVAMSVTMLGLCIGLTYLFAPVKWLFHQLLVE